MPTSTESSPVAPLKLREVMCSPTLIVATWFGSGLAPVASGTFGSLAALPFVWLLMQLSISLALLLIVFLFFLGVATGRVLGQRMAEPDHGAIVVDEVVGVLLAVLLPSWLLAGWAPPYVFVIAGFIAFRAYDILKPWPVSYFDRSWKNAWGVMLDDVFAGLLAAAVVAMSIMVPAFLVPTG
jgi:phosphatidylglycerophosphatase A